MRLPYLLAAPVMVLYWVSVPPTASADCSSTGGTTICSQGDVRGGGGGGGPGSGPSVPYPCEYDYMCDDYGGWQIYLDADLDPGLPGRPGNRPGGGGDGIGGGGSGGGGINGGGGGGRGGGGRGR